jgi:hypothetical protein
VCRRIQPKSKGLSGLIGIFAVAVIIASIISDLR